MERFVNGIVDPAQKGQYAQSVASIADSIGLPGWFVDLRHAGTHEALPSISLLRSGCAQVFFCLVNVESVSTRQALEWLNANYWTVQKNYIPENRNECRVMLKAYKEARRSQLTKGVIRLELSLELKHALAKADLAKPALIEADKNTLLKMADLESLLNAETYREILLPILFEDGFLIPSQKRYSTI